MPGQLCANRLLLSMMSYVLKKYESESAAPKPNAMQCTSLIGEDTLWAAAAYKHEDACETLSLHVWVPGNYSAVNRSPRPGALTALKEDTKLNQSLSLIAVK